ncbi:MAG: chlorophyllide reductase [Devosia sp.]
MAAPTTSTGRISVTQVMEMVQRARSDATARNTIVAYLAGVGETAGFMVSEAVVRGATPLKCTNSFNLSEDVALAALSAGAPDTASWAETPATPIILADLFARAGCN